MARALCCYLALSLLVMSPTVLAQRGGTQTEGDASRGGAAAAGSNRGGSSGGNTLGGGSLGGPRAATTGGISTGLNAGKGNSGQGGASSQSNGCYVNGVFKKDCAGGKSDPLMSGFAGRPFAFQGDVNKNYSLVSEANHQFSMHLKFARLHDHNGTNMDRFGLLYKTFRVEMAITPSEEVTVAVNDKLLPPKVAAQTHAWRYLDGSGVEMTWDRNAPGIGNTVRFTTDVLQITTWFVPAGLLEPQHPNFVLSSYLNFNITLLGTPYNNVMEGIIGETYQRYTAGLAAISDPNNTALYENNDNLWHGKHPIQQYEMASLWDTAYPLSLFNSSKVVGREAV